MKIYIKVKHLGGGYTDIEDCPLARAMKEQIPNVKSHASVYCVYIDGEYHRIIGGYESNHYNVDWLKSILFFWNKEKVLRTLEIKYEN